MLDKKMIPEVGGIAKVRGNRIATPLVPPNPGRRPMIIPNSTPPPATRMFSGLKAILNPYNK
jgi:hypothetical protein